MVSRITLFFFFNFSIGLKLHGILALLHKHRQEAEQLLVQGDQESGSSILRFYLAQYSTEPEKKKQEEMVVYNFRRFIKKVESK